MKSTLQNNFLYLEGNDKADVLFHIKSSKFFRIFDAGLMGGFRNFFWNDSSDIGIVNTLQEVDENNKSCVNDCSSCKVPAATNAKEFVINKLALVLTSKCNLRCKYCYANYGMFDYEEETDISEEVLLTGLNYLTDNFKDITNIQFFGGEPSLCEEQIQSTVHFFEEQVRTGKKEKMPRFGIVTNGVHMPESLMDIFIKYDFHITISIDGPEDINNELRSDIKGYGKHKLIKQNFNRLLEKGMKNIGIECTYTAEHIRRKISLVRLIEYFDQEFGCKVPHIVPVNIERENQLSVMNYLEQYIDNVQEVIDYTFEKMINHFTLKSTAIIAGIIYKIMFHKGQQRICPAGVKTFSLSHDNRISPCFMYTSNQDISYGAIGDNPDEILRKAYEFDERINNKEISKDCMQCHARTLCSSCLGSFEIDKFDVKVDNPIFCETTKFVSEYVLKKLSEIKADEEKWNQLNDFLRKGVNEK